MTPSAALARARRELGRALDFLLPPACAGCGGALAASMESEPVCRNCRLGLRPLPLPGCPRCSAPLGTGANHPGCLECAGWPRELETAGAACVLRPPASGLVHALKYQGWRGVGVYMGREMARRAGGRLAAGDVAVPIPTTPARLRRRGYNQAEVIATAFAGARGLEVAPALARPEATESQTALGPAARAANVQSSFKLRQEYQEELEGRILILVDDVITTGATVCAAARVLESARPAAILAYAFARRIPFEH